MASSIALEAAGDDFDEDDTTLETQSDMILPAIKALLLLFPPLESSINATGPMFAAREWDRS